MFSTEELQQLLADIRHEAEFGCDADDGEWAIGRSDGLDAAAEMVVKLLTTRRTVLC